ncbi:hypothetical protein RYA05_14435 [Pseudomonas syringae pv. actinidiae]|uniref:Uncharacterized protein n=17 Tax=Pseudomonas syringae group TaxID=136849 RepID=A0AAW4E434_PSESX|nr:MULTISPECIES: hypothetical protein [Pseudomonas]EPN02137.1 hypothetical protein A259_25705 [Pseudomonas syringae pv. actinidiae ICMP 19070]EPN66185.1 hypothetical protein A235_12028 [Pseudomonas syringae pv. actinidiae ICMP 19079]EPN70563.1 hypothetical protein A234_23910 [Pseudomonas syringae pv. actinidiae ICMP 19101]AAO57599.1 protein of unknown function [Pseudomonas syringae pv. tomato str. DC3000]AKT31970.1 hypothetical protein IYO_021085 [Pseudomonas syringae pv. actinidiae ICMP 18884
MKTHFKISDQVQSPLNEIGLLAWSLMAHSDLSPELNMVGGGIPGTPGPDTPEQPIEPGIPTLPDDPPPAPVA